MSKYYEILKYIKESKGRSWVIQKYIENPLIIHKKKFDIRQWVLVTDWNPLTVWIYNDNYIRFALMDYDPKNRIKFAHLTNNCLVQKFNQSPLKGKKKTQLDDESSEEELGNIWGSEEFSEHLQ